LASSRRIFSSKRLTSLVGSMMSMLFMASCTWVCASTVFERAMSSSRFELSCPSFSRIAFRPCLSWSTT
jgi:hypothetical protein